MKTALKYYVGINVKADRRQVFGVHGTPTAASHGKHFSAVIGPFSNLRAALYVRDRGFNNPQIRCPADAEKLCRVRSGPTYQRTAAKLKRRKGSVLPASRRKKKATRRARRAAPVRRRKNPVIGSDLRFASSSYNEALKAYNEARLAYRARKIGDDEFLRVRKAFDAASAVWDDVAKRAPKVKTKRTKPSHTQTTFALNPARRRNPVSKLRSGERQGDIFARVQEPFRLAGQRGTDHARLQADRQAKAKAARDFATRRQLDFETNPRRRKNPLREFDPSLPKFKRARLTKEQKKALTAYNFANQQEDRYMGSVFVNAHGQRKVQERTRAAYEACKRLGMGTEHGL